MELNMQFFFNQFTNQCNNLVNDYFDNKPLTNAPVVDFNIRKESMGFFFSSNVSSQGI